MSKLHDASMFMGDLAIICISVAISLAILAAFVITMLDLYSWAKRCWTSRKGKP